MPPNGPNCVWLSPFRSETELNERDATMCFGWSIMAVVDGGTVLGHRLLIISRALP